MREKRQVFMNFGRCGGGWGWGNLPLMSPGSACGLEEVINRWIITNWHPNQRWPSAGKIKWCCWVRETVLIDLYLTLALPIPDIPGGICGTLPSSRNSVEKQQMCRPNEEEILRYDLPARDISWFTATFLWPSAFMNHDNMQRRGIVFLRKVMYARSNIKKNLTSLVFSVQQWSIFAHSTLCQTRSEVICLWIHQGKVTRSSAGRCSTCYHAKRTLAAYLCSHSR